MRLHVVYKVCDNVDAVHREPRPFNLTKKEIVKVCLKSLALSIQSLDHYCSVVGDNVSSEIFDLVTQTLNPINTFNAQGPNNYAYTMVKASEFALTSHDNELIYMIEDDYLHDFQVFPHRLKDFLWLMDVYKFALPFFLHPSDYPEEYRPSRLSRSYVLQGKTGFWREVQACTETYICQSQFYKKKASFFQEKHISGVTDGRGSDWWLSSLFKKEALCFCPLPGMATHMHIVNMSSYINWQKIVTDLSYEK